MLGPGVIGHILKNRQVNPANHSIADRWFHYDQVGTVISTTDANGDEASRIDMDAFGVRLGSWDTMLPIAVNPGGWGQNTKGMLN